MPSTYTTSLTLEKQATGENSNTWGTKTNVNFDLIEEAIAGYVSATMTDADYTLTATQGVSNEARNMTVEIVGTLTQARNVIVPTADKLYFIKNSTTGGFAITVKTSGGSGISVANGETEVLYCNGTNVVRGQTTPTGTGAPVRATSPTITTAVFSGTMTGTYTLGGTPSIAYTALTGLGTGVATFLGSPTTGNLLAAVTGETGTGALVFGTSPTIASPTLTGTVTGDAGANLNLNAVTGQNIYLTINGAAIAIVNTTGLIMGTYPISASAGTEAAPGLYSVTGTSDTGIWFPAADTMAVSTAGVERVRWKSGGEQLQKANATSGITNLFNGRVSDNYGAHYFYNNDGTTNQFNFSWSPSEVRFTNVNGVTTFYAGATERLRIDTSGNVILTSATLLGYGTGAGGTQTQGTNRTTAVTLNKPCGSITLVSAAGTTAWQTFTVNNSLVAATDTIIVNQKSGTDLYEIHVTAVAAGSFNLTYRTMSGTTTEQPVFNFSVLKAVTS